MIIKLSPQRRDDTLVVVKTGDILTINGTVFDFTALPDGATLPAKAVDCECVPADVHRINGELHLTLLLPHGPNPTQEQSFPADIVNPPDGDIPLPQNSGGAQ